MTTELFPDFQVILVPGLHDSGPDHWQTRWQRAHPEFYRVEQADWSDPDLPAWAARLDQVRRRDPRPALFVAHSFGCLTVVHSIASDATGVAGALLAAPADPDKFGIANLLPATPLPVPSVMISSADDPWMSSQRAALWAARWHSELVDVGACGHINTESGLGDWPVGQKQLRRVFDLAQNRGVACSAR